MEVEKERLGGSRSTMPRARRRSASFDFTIFCTKEMRVEIRAADNRSDKRCQERCRPGRRDRRGSPPQPVFDLLLSLPRLLRLLPPSPSPSGISLIC